jgi:hypothetical protein
VWRGDFVADKPVLGLIGRADGRALSPSAIADIDGDTAALAETLAVDSGYLAHPAGLWLHFAGDLRADAPWVRAARRNTQDLPWLELLRAREPARGGVASGPCVGAPVQRFLDELRAPDGLDAEHLRWRALGRELFEASWFACTGAEEEARARALGVLQRLPPEIRASVLGRAARQKPPR